MEKKVTQEFEQANSRCSIHLEFKGFYWKPLFMFNRHDIRNTNQFFNEFFHKLRLTSVRGRLHSQSMVKSVAPRSQGSLGKALRH